MNGRDDMDNRERGGVYSQMVYQKGAAILLMLEGWLGETQFRDGLRSYLKAHKFGIASTADLAQALHKSSGVDPTAVMHAFLDKTGIPLVRAEVRCQQGGEARVHLEVAGDSEVPVCWRTAGVERRCTVVSAPRDVVLPKASGCPGWVYSNAGATGYYRTTWTSAQLATLALDKLSAAERLQLVYDLASLKKAGQTDVAATLTKLTGDAEPEIVKAASDALK